MIGKAPNTDMPSFSNIQFIYHVANGSVTIPDPDFLQQFNLPDSGHLIDALIPRIHANDVEMLKNAYAQLLAGEFSGNLRFKLSGTAQEQWIRLTPFLYQHQGATLIAGNVSDISDEVSNDTAMKKYANKKNSTLHMLAHDLRGPLNVAKSLIHVVEVQLSDPAVLKKTNYVTSIIQGSINLITSLVNREFLETVETALLKKRLDIVKKLAEYLEECRLSADMAERTFHLSASHEEIFMDLDEAKFMQVVNNLVSNSLKFTRPGGSISVNVTDHADIVEFVFADNGIGIPEALQPGLFDKFTSSRRTGLNGEPTVGLGLSIVKTIIDWHNGQIRCESKENEGAAFIFHLPKVDPDK